MPWLCGKGRRGIRIAAGGGDDAHRGARRDVARELPGDVRAAEDAEAQRRVVGSVGRHGGAFSQGERGRHCRTGRSRIARALHTTPTRPGRAAGTAALVPARADAHQRRLPVGKAAAGPGARGDRRTGGAAAAHRVARRLTCAIGTYFALFRRRSAAIRRVATISGYRNPRELETMATLARSGSPCGPAGEDHVGNRTRTHQLQGSRTRAPARRRQLRRLPDLRAVFLGLPRVGAREHGPAQVHPHGHAGDGRGARRRRPGSGAARCASAASTSAR